MNILNRYKMKKWVIFFLLFIVMPSVFADWFYNSQNIIANIDIYSDAEVVPLTPSGYIESATINLTFFPKHTLSQELLKFTTIPQAEITDETLKFIWKRPEDKIDFRLNANVKTTNTIKEIREKIKFPIERLPEDIIKYTKPSETIDSNNEDIIKIASELAKGEDDLYVAVFKIADWTKNNIEYDLSTLTAEVSQKASWVLQNKQGVCDELTSLFIALLRAVGVPARFVSGIAYTNSPLFPEQWGPHGWAEVYFPGYGWVPFDVTYGEFGWIDPTHIKFKESIDSDEPSTYYQWLGRNADLKTRKLDIKTNLVNTLGYFKVPLNLEASAVKKAVNFGSYNLVEVAIENLNDFYYATELSLNKPQEVKIIGSELKSILLLPREKKKILWMLKVDDNLDRRYSYTFPLIIATLSNISSETNFISNTREKHVSFEEIEQIAKILEQEKEKKYSGNVDFNCESERGEFFQYEDVKVYCNIRNTGNIFLDDVDVCFENKCERVSLGISQSKNVTFDIEKSKVGYRESEVTLKSGLVSKISYVNFKITDEPKIEIEELQFPINVSYNENFTISFTLEKKSFANPKNIEVIFDQNGIQKKWSFDELTENKKFALRFVGNQLRYGKNDNKINVHYSDGLNKKYNAYQEFSIELPKARVTQRFVLALNAIGAVFERIGLATIAMMLLVGSIAYIVVIFLVFRKSD